LDVLDFGHAHILFFHLQAKIGLFYDSCKKSCTFLRAIQHTEYVDVVTLLQTSVESFQDPYDKGYLPTHLCLMGLAQRLDKNWRLHILEVIPCVHCIQDIGIAPVLGMMTVVIILKFIVPTSVAMVAIPRVMPTVLMVVMVMMLGALIVLMAAPDTPLVDVTRLIGAAMLALITTGACLIRIFNGMRAKVSAMLRRCVMCLLRLIFSPNK
jgi:hypothetical protein